MIVGGSETSCTRGVVDGHSANAQGDIVEDFMDVSNILTNSSS